MLSSEARAGDGPVEQPEHDDFQRAGFAQRIAQTLSSRTEASSIVLGLYGKWGEGKSTVLNFIRRTLAADENIIVVSFNPWRFPDEAQLLHSFFTQLAQQIDEAVPPPEPPETLVEKWFPKLHKWLSRTDKPLHTRTESLTQLLTDYAGSLTFAGINVGKVVGAAVPGPNLDKLRRRVEEKIAAAGKRIVLIIDDIDRLEKQQIQAVFRLVKLTADFKHTAYLLAFDELMVARVLGEVYASGNEVAATDTLTAGQHFLEKIIQVQLRLPRASQQALLNYCAARVAEALQDTDTELDSEPAQRAGQDTNWQRFGDALRRGILPQLATPRQAIRYANAIRFSLPLLRGEANPVDLMLVEALGIFYPELYRFVSLRPDDFTGSAYGHRPVINLDGGEDEAEDLNKQLEKLFRQYHYSADSKRGARTLLGILFPRVAGPSGYWGDADANRKTAEAQLNREQAIAAPAYFSRYFSYSVASGEVTDQEWTELLSAPALRQEALLRNFIDRQGAAVALQKIDYQVPELTADQSRGLWAALLEVADRYQPQPGWLTLGRGELSQAASLMLDLLSNLPDPATRRQLITSGISTGGTFNLAYELDQQLQLQAERESRPNDITDRSPRRRPLFAATEWEAVLGQLPQALLDRALREAGSRPLYETHPEHAAKLLLFIWPRLTDRQPPAEYVLGFLREKPTDLYEFLRVCSEKISLGTGPYHLGGLPKSRVQQLIDIIGSQLSLLARQLYGDGRIEKVDFEEFEEPTNEQRLRQFIFWAERLA